jgi:lipopolysaccharide transport system permease protein
MGFSWALIRPFVQMVVFTLVFGRWAGIKGDGESYAVFSFLALVPWTYFSSSATGSTGSLVSNMGIITKVYFPRLIIPLTPILAKLFDFFIAFIFIFILCFILDVSPKHEVVYFPILILLMIITSLAVGLWLSALAIQYRDINQIMQFGTQLLMFAAPVIWPISIIPENLVFYYGFYPLAGIIEGFRACFIVGKDMPFDLILSGYATSVFLLFTGLYYFNRKERFFADVA